MRFRTIITGFSIIALVIPGVIGQELRCNDRIPAECKTTRFLGEDKGCACFECNPGTQQARVVCTRDPEKKRALWALVPHTNAVMTRRSRP
jgi:hypothetical protein